MNFTKEEFQDISNDIYDDGTGYYFDKDLDVYEPFDYSLIDMNDIKITDSMHSSLVPPLLAYHILRVLEINGVDFEYYPCWNEDELFNNPLLQDITKQDIENESELYEGFMPLPFVIMSPISSEDIYNLSLNFFGDTINRSFAENIKSFKDHERAVSLSGDEEDNSTFDDLNIKDLVIHTLMANYINLLIWLNNAKDGVTNSFYYDFWYDQKQKPIGHGYTYGNHNMECRTSTLLRVDVIADKMNEEGFSIVSTYPVIELNHSSIISIEDDSTDFVVQEIDYIDATPPRKACMYYGAKSNNDFPYKIDYEGLSPWWKEETEDRVIVHFPYDINQVSYKEDLVSISKDDIKLTTRKTLTKSKLRTILKSNPYSSTEKEVSLKGNERLIAIFNKLHDDAYGVVEEVYNFIIEEQNKRKDCFNSIFLDVLNGDNDS